VTRTLPAVVLCASALVGAVPRGAAVTQGSVAAVRLETWRKAVERHAPGEPDEAARTIAAWPNGELFAAIESVQRTTPQNSVLVRGAVLHLDVAILFRTAAEGPLFPSRSSDKYFAVTALDGQRRGDVASPTHLQFARALLEELEPEPRRSDAARLWYRATASYLASRYNLAEAVVHLERGRQLYPGDTEILLASGCLHETFAAPRIQAVARMGVGVGRLLTIGSETQNLQTAERYFRESTRSDPRNAEARLRLGRVLSLQGRHREAVPHLQQVLKDAGDPARTYLASLFLGREEEARGRTAEARQHFDRAARLFPGAQSAHLALSRLAFHDGDVPRAERAIERLFALPDDERERYDPWRDYFSGTGRLAASFLARLYDEIRRDAR
jgi:tetratricopeptide (TPR) repeat protein